MNGWSSSNLRPHWNSRSNNLSVVNTQKKIFRKKKFGQIRSIFVFRFLVEWNSKRLTRLSISGELTELSFVWQRRLPIKSAHKDVDTDEKFSSFKIYFFWGERFFSANTYTQRQCILSFDKSTAMYILRPKTYALAGLKPGISCSGGGRDDHYATRYKGMKSFHLIPVS
jgi:hypothetical protein